jgi:hypothetical protein
MQRAYGIQSLQHNQIKRTLQHSCLRSHHESLL